jgi:hypothetical protein
VRLRIIAELLGFSGDLVPDVEHAGRSFAAAVIPDMEEIERRMSADESAILDRYVLAALFQLPEGQWIPRGGLDPVIQGVLDTVPWSAVVNTRTEVMRVWRPALRVAGVIVEATSWQKGLERAGRFAPDARRACVLPLSRLDRAAIEECLQYGVGAVLTRSSESPRVVVSASTQIRGRPSPRHWQFLESVYEAWTGMRPMRSAQAAR